MGKGIVVDLDGTVVDTYGRKFCVRAQQLCGKLVKPSQLIDYKFTEVTDLTQEDMICIFSSKGFYETLSPLPKAISSLKKLYDAGFELHFMTVRPSNTHVRTETLQWLGKKQIPFNSIHLLTHAEGGLGKARVAKALGLDYFLEDNPSYAEELSKSGLQGFLIKTRYNEKCKLPKHTKFVTDLSEAAARLLA